MNLDKAQLTISMTSGEAYDLAFHIVYSLRRSVEDHYITHALRVFEQAQNVNAAIEMMHQLFSMAGYLKSGPGFVEEMREQIIKAQKEREAKVKKK